MRTLIALTLALLLSACGGDAKEAEVATDMPNDFCDCINKPPTSEAGAKACGILRDAMSAADIATRTQECKNP